MSDIKERVIKVISEGLSMDEKEITLEKSFADLEADSLDVVELIMAFEEEFDIEIPDETAEGLKDIKAVVDYITEQAA